jgi:glycosyltransferase involved in cell wall biosynthesis
MRILHVIPSYEPAWAFGGTVTATSQLCRALARQGVDVTVYTTDADGKGGHLDVPLNETVDLDGVKATYFHCNFGINKAFYSKDLSSKLRKTVKSFDIVHISAIWQWIGMDVYKFCKIFHKPYLISTHGSFSPWPWKQNMLKKKTYWYLFGKKIIKKAKAIHFTSEDERLKSFSTVPLLKKIPGFIVPNGIDIKNTKKSKDIRANLNIPKDKFVLLFVGRIHKVKGIDFIIKALEKINSSRLLFLIVGNKEDIEYIKLLHNLSKYHPNNVIWHEPVRREHVWDFYHSSDLFVLPSYSENFGMVVVEAMACGLPGLISRNVGIWREVQSDNAGFIVNQDVDEITDVLKKCLENPGILQKLSLNARKSAESRYDINKVASLMIKAYENVLSGRRSPELQWL